MKRILQLSLISLLLVGCSKDSEYENPSENLPYSIDAFTEFRGVFTTADGEDRAKVYIKILTSQKAIAILDMASGITYSLEGSAKASAISTKKGYFFKNNHISFELELDNTHTPEVKNVLYFGKFSEIVVLLHTSLAPVTPVIGTFECGTCNGHPILGSPGAKTFNFIFATPNGEGSIVTQTTLNTTIYNGIGIQHNCVLNGNFTTCDIESGDGVSTTAGFLANGNPVTWNAQHIFNNEASGVNDCSGVSGTWQWPSISYGVITGTFVSDNACNVTLYTEDFIGYTGSGFTPSPAAGQLDSDIIIANGFSGSLNYGGTQTTGDYARGISTGGVATGGIYAFNTGAGNIGLGVQPAGSDFTPGEFDFRIENTSGRTLTNFTISYDIYINNNEDRGNSFNFLYSTDGINFTQVNLLDYTSPSAADGNGFVLVSKNGTFSVSVTSGSFIYLRFEGDDVNGSNNRDEFALDNIVLEGN